jgi:hypothetical protein
MDIDSNPYKWREEERISRRDAKNAEALREEGESRGWKVDVLHLCALCGSA